MQKDFEQIQFILQKRDDPEARQNLEAYFARDKMPLPDTQEIWAFRTENLLDLRFMLSFLTVVCPKEFFIAAGSIKDILSKENKDENLQIFEEIIFQIKEFFINRNLDGKSLFRVLSKQAQKYFSNKERPSPNVSTEFNYA